MDTQSIAALNDADPVKGQYPLERKLRTLAMM